MRSLSSMHLNTKRNLHSIALHPIPIFSREEKCVLLIDCEHSLQFEKKTVRVRVSSSALFTTHHKDKGNVEKTRFTILTMLGSLLCSCHPFCKYNLVLLFFQG